MTGRQKKTARARCGGHRRYATVYLWPPCGI